MPHVDAKNNALSMYGITLIPLRESYSSSNYIWLAENKSGIIFQAFKSVT